MYYVMYLFADLQFLGKLIIDILVFSSLNKQAFNHPCATIIQLAVQFSVQHIFTSTLKMEPACYVHAIVAQHHVATA